VLSHIGNTDFEIGAQLSATNDDSKHRMCDQGCQAELSESLQQAKGCTLGFVVSVVVSVVFDHTESFDLDLIL
jgi:hypothetical protein